MKCTIVECCFCQSKNATLLYTEQYHKIKKDHGPITFYKCNDCHSGFTFPLPTAIQLFDLYNSFSGGLDNYTRQMRNNNPLNKWFEICISNALKYCEIPYNTNDSFEWIDIGAGNGELARSMSQKFPRSKGIAIDFHARPEMLEGCPNIQWIECNLNKPDFYQQINMKNPDFVFCITVLEHILNPKLFLDNLIKILGNGKVLYLTTPDFGSIAAKILKSYWPYLIFGEHLNIPSKGGIKILLHRLLKDSGIENKRQFFVEPTILPYPLGYYLQYYHINPRFFSGNKMTLNLPTGILKAGVYNNF